MFFFLPFFFVEHKKTFFEKPRKFLWGGFFVVEERENVEEGREKRGVLNGQIKLEILLWAAWGVWVLHRVGARRRESILSSRVYIYVLHKQAYEDEVRFAALQKWWNRKWCRVQNDNKHAGRMTRGEFLSQLFMNFHLDTALHAHKRKYTVHVFTTGVQWNSPIFFKTVK